jgi:hypothetical protein
MSRKQRRRRASCRPASTIVRDCLIYAQSIAALKAAHEMDPDPDGRYAAHHAEHLRERGTRALGRLTQTEAATPDELRGKARVAALLIADGHGALEEEVEAFMTALLLDIEFCLQGAIFVPSASFEQWR